MPSTQSTFYFESYSFEKDTKELTFTYSYDKEVSFTETVLLNTSKQLEDSEALQRSLFNLHLALGISYWKAYTPKTIVIESGTLTQEQAEFWNTVYTKGLGEFFYQNGIDFTGLIQFPYDESATIEPLQIKPFGTALVPLGGGKDSLTSIELLQQMNQQFDTFSVGSYDVINQQVGALRSTHVKAMRDIDPALFEHNASGAMNGHVPISMIYAFTAMVVAVVQRYKYVVLSNERSANIGNVRYLDQEINHQWSKSLEFEQLLRQYIHSTLTEEIEYFSLLRPLSELHIAQLFSGYPSWLPLFSSDNANFRLNDPSATLWSGESPKEAFVFTILAPFIPKAQLVATVGTNFFARDEMLPTFKELLGKEGAKPFDCVGTPEETIVAFALAHEGGEYAGDPIMEYVAQEVLPSVEHLEQLKQEVMTPSAEHCLPERFQAYLEELA